MKQQLRTFIRNCDICQRHKAEATKPAGLLQPLPIPEHIWSAISMDFIDGLPKSYGHTTIFVVVDRFSKYGHFSPLKHPYTVPQVAQTFFEVIFVCMEFLLPSYLIGTLCSLEFFGGSSYAFMARNSTLALPITPK